MDFESLLDEAEAAIRLAIENIAKVADKTGQSGLANAYIIPHLESWIDGREQITIETLRDKLNEKEEDGDW